MAVIQTGIIYNHIVGSPGPADTYKEVKTMKNLSVPVLLLVMLGLIISIISCSQPQATKTVTVTQTGTSSTVTSSASFTKTITIRSTVTTTSQGSTKATTQAITTTPVFSMPPPEIPHSLLFSMPGIPWVPGEPPFCFECHLVPPQHDGWLTDTELCTECHYVSDMPFDK